MILLLWADLVIVLPIVIFAFMFLENFKNNVLHFVIGLAFMFIAIYFRFEYARLAKLLTPNFIKELKPMLMIATVVIYSIFIPVLIYIERSRGVIEK